MSKRIVVAITDEKDAVTGTCQLLRTTFPEKIWTPFKTGFSKTLDFLVDCGFSQGTDQDSEFNSHFKYDYSKVAFSILTHGHLDHYGKFPKLIKDFEYDNPVFTTYPTKTFVDKVALDDCLKILKRNAKKAGTEPIYDIRELNRFRSCMVGCNFNFPVQYNENIIIHFFPNGHLPGAAVTLVQISYPGYSPVNLIFTGDYNDHNLFFEVPKLPRWVRKLENVTIVMESTYGTSLTSEMPEPCLVDNILEALNKKSMIFIPVFSLGRTQEVLYRLKMLETSGKSDPRIPIYLDGKTAQENTNLYIGGAFEMFHYMRNFLPTNFHYVLDKTMRKSLIEDGIPKIILSSSGMGTHGPSSNYIKKLLEKPMSLIQFTGYLSPDSLGGKIMNTPTGEEFTFPGGHTCIKSANIMQTRELSAHGYSDVLVTFAKQFNHLKSIVLHHGESEVKEGFREFLRKELGLDNIGILDSETGFIITTSGIVSKYSTK